LTLARAAAAHPLGLLGNLIWTSGTLRDALGRAVKFYGVVTQRTSLALVDGDVVTLRQHAVAGRGAILAEYPFASLVLRARIATSGRFAARAVRFAHAGSSTVAYREVFGVEVEFGTRDEIEIDRAMLDLRLASGDPLTVGVLESTAAQLVAAQAQDPFLDRVRRAAADQLAVEPSLASIAKALGTSERTLRRQLEQHETSLRAVLDDVRRARADELLAAGSPLKEIAFVLGFSEPSAFSRAYKRWTGKAPRE
jgi:AraC-like DNA-binding protein